MHWLDIILLLLLGFGALLGARSGFIKQIARIVTFGLAIYLCVYLHEPVAGTLASKVSGVSPFGAKILSFVVIFLSVLLVGYLITSWIDKLVQAAQLKPLDRLLGAGVGALKAGLLAGVMLMGVIFFSGSKTPEDFNESRIAPVVIKGMRVVLVAVPQKYKDQLSHSVEKIKTVGAEEAAEHFGPKGPGKNPATPKQPKPVDPLNDPLPDPFED